MFQVVTCKVATYYYNIDHVLPSGVGWEASVAQRIIQRWWIYWAVVVPPWLKWKLHSYKLHVISIVLFQWFIFRSFIYNPGRKQTPTESERKKSVDKLIAWQRSLEEQGLTIDKRKDGK